MNFATWIENEEASHGTYIRIRFSNSWQSGIFNSSVGLELDKLEQPFPINRIYDPNEKHLLFGVPESRAKQAVAFLRECLRKLNIKASIQVT